MRIYRIKEFMKEQIYEEPTGKRTIIPTIITPKLPATRNCSVQACESCMLACSKNISVGPTKVKPLPEIEGDLTRYKY